MVIASRASISTFGFLWAFALLYHQVAYGVFRASPFDIALTLFASLVLLQPASRHLLALLCISHILVVLHALPRVTNHWYFAGIVSGAFLLALLGAWWAARRGGPPADHTSIHDRFAPAGRLSVALVYGLSGFHKLNSDFFTPGVSCATVLTGRAARFLGVESVMPDPGMMVVWLTILVELGLPFLLLIPRTRVVGLVVAIGFHVVMALAGYPRFSATGIALLSLFLPASAFRLPAAEAALSAWRVPLVAVRGAMVVGLMGLALTSSTWDGRAFLTMQLTLSALLLVAVLRTWSRGEPLPAAVATSRAVRWRQPTLVAPILLVVIATQPYLGLPTDRALGMYSNLRTEGGGTNHYLIPATWQPFRFQHDIAEVVSSSRAGIQALATAGMVVPFEELRARLTLELRRDRDDFGLVYRRDGAVWVVPSVRDDPDLALPVPRLQWMFFRFRPVEISGPRACSL